jgi:hypothetical protein
LLSGPHYRIKDAVRNKERNKLAPHLSRIRYSIPTRQAVLVERVCGEVEEEGSSCGGSVCDKVKEGGSVEGGRTCQVCDLSGRHLIEC